MNMVGHNDELVQNDRWEMIRNVTPDGFHDESGVVCLHSVLLNLSEERLSESRADGEKIGPWGSIIVPLKADGAAGVAEGVVAHLKIVGPFRDLSCELYEL